MHKTIIALQQTLQRFAEWHQTKHVGTAPCQRSQCRASSPGGSCSRRTRASGCTPAAAAAAAARVAAAPSGTAGLARNPAALTSRCASCCRQPDGGARELGRDGARASPRDLGCLHRALCTKLTPALGSVGVVMGLVSFSGAGYGLQAGAAAQDECQVALLTWCWSGAEPSQLLTAYRVWGHPSGMGPIRCASQQQGLR